MAVLKSHLNRLLPRLKSVSLFRSDSEEPSAKDTIKDLPKMKALNEVHFCKQVALVSPQISSRRRRPKYMV